MRYGPPFQFARRRDGRRLAYQVVGDGELDLVFLFGWPTHLGLLWEEPSFAGFLSNVGSGRAAFFGCHTGGRLALLLAATHPDEVSAVVTFGSHPATLRDDDYPWGATPEERDQIFASLEAWHPSEVADRLLAALAPAEAGNPAVRQWWRMFSASASSPVETLEGIRSLGPVDIRGLLGTIQAPVLVLHRTGDRLASVQASRYMAERIPGARLVELPGDGFLARAGAGEIVCSRTAKDLVAGAGFAFADRGTHRLKGVPDSWELYAVEPAEA
jgi:pimeloyl-ACP methyl ester carboxylesterase